MSRFELPRDYGFFIGDAIPLTLVIEADREVILDLVNLPRAGNTHGLFEIRQMALHTTTLSNRTKVYRVAYTLQYFGPTPFTAPFGPLELLYALPDKAASLSAPYTYRSLFTQPAMVHLARLGPQYSTPAVTIKGPWDDARNDLVRGLAGLGAACMLAALWGWGRQWHRSGGWRRGASAQTLTTAEQAIQQLRQEATTVLQPPAAIPSPGARLDHIVRTYIQATHHIPALTLTLAELATQLRNRPQGQALLEVLERCEALKYQPSSAARPAAERELWHSTVALFEAIQQERAA